MTDHDRQIDEVFQELGLLIQQSDWDVRKKNAIVSKFQGKLRRCAFKNIADTQSDDPPDMLERVTKPIWKKAFGNVLSGMEPKTAWDNAFITFDKRTKKELITRKQGSFVAKDIYNHFLPHSVMLRIKDNKVLNKRLLLKVNSPNSQILELFKQVKLSNRLDEAEILQKRVETVEFLDLLHKLGVDGMSEVGYITITDKEKVIELKRAGFTQVNTAKVLGFSRSKVVRLWKED